GADLHAILAALAHIHLDRRRDEILGAHPAHHMTWLGPGLVDERRRRIEEAGDDEPELAMPDVGVVGGGHADLTFHSAIEAGRADQLRPPPPSFDCTSFR